MRGITLEGENLFEGRKHNKTFTPKTRREIGGKRLNSLPAGFVLKDPEQFLLHAREGIVLLEGPITGASFAKFAPSFQYQTMINLGTEYQPTIAFMRGLGMKGDAYSGLRIGIGKVWLATDFDKGGLEAFYRLEEQIRRNFPEVAIATVHELLPQIVLNRLPDVFKNGLPPDDPQIMEGIFGEGGSLCDRTLDLNDLLLMPGIRERYAYAGPIDLPF
jgi:hypothetical protein